MIIKGQSETLAPHFVISCQWEFKTQALMGVCRAARGLLRIITEN